MHKRLVGQTIACCLMAGLLTACGNSRTTSASRPGKTLAAVHAKAHLRNVTLRFSWIANGQDAPFVAAKAEGFYKQAGFAVRLAQGKGSTIAGETVGNGSDTFGFADASAAALLIAKNVPIKVIAVYTQESPNSFIYNRSHPLRSPKDLVGRLVVSSAGNGALVELPAILADAGVKMNQLKIATVSPQSFGAELLKHPDAVALGTSLSYALTKVDPSAVFKPFSDFGANIYSLGLITNDNEIKQHPNAVQRFVAATNEGWTFAQQHPKQTVKDLLAAFPHTDRKVALVGLKNALASLHTAATIGHPLGWMAASDWMQSIGILKRYGHLTGDKPLSDYYTNAFIPHHSL